MAARVVVLGGGAGGTVVANHLARWTGIDVTLVDNHGKHLYQAALLYLPFIGGSPSDFEQDEAPLVLPTVKLRIGRVKGVDPDQKRVTLEDGTLDYDWLVIATGSRVHDASVPGFREFADHFHCPPAAEQLQKKLPEFKGGKVVVGIAGQPYKCPPTPVEFALLFEEWLRKRGGRDRAELVYITPMDRVLSKPEVAAAAQPWLEEAGYRIETGFTVDRVEKGAVLSKEGKRLEFDLMVAVPPHAGAPYLRNSALAGPLGFVPCDPRTMKVRDRVYALGDAADVPAPKTGAAAQEAAPVVAENIHAEIDGRDPGAKYSGHVVCFMETGGRKAARIEFDYDNPPPALVRAPLHHYHKAMLHQFYFKTLPLK